jgi:hypothetical protein
MVVAFTKLCCNINAQCAEHLAATCSQAFTSAHLNGCCYVPRQLVTLGGQQQWPATDNPTNMHIVVACFTFTGFTFTDNWMILGQCEGAAARLAVL